MIYIQILFTILGNFNFGFIISKKQNILIIRIAIYLFGKCAIIKRNNTSYPKNIVSSTLDNIFKNNLYKRFNK